MLYFIADFGQLGHPPGESSHFAGLSILREPFGKNHASSGSCFLYSKPVENHLKKKGSQQALFWGKTRTPYAPKVLRKGGHAKKENFSLAESHYTLHQGRSPAFFKTILAESICPLGFSFLNKDPPSRGPATTV